MAIIMALFTRHVLISLLSGIVVGVIILADFSVTGSLQTSIDLFYGLLIQSWILKTLAFVMMVGSVMALISDSGGINGFIHFVQERHKLIRSPRAALLVAYLIGWIIFIESSITILIAGAVSRPLTDSYGVSRAKLAYVCDSTSAPVSSLIVLNGWGALLLGLIASQIESGMLEGESVELLLKAIPYNFYAIIALIVTFTTIWFGIDVGPMRHAEVIASDDDTQVSGKAGHMLWPIFVMVVSVFGVLFITGEGNILQGSGSSAIFYALIITLLFALIYYRSTGAMSTMRWLRSSLSGAKSMIGIVFIMLLAFAIGDVTKSLGTGLYLASFASDMLPAGILAAVIFLLASIMAFSTGTSWGTFSLMIPIAIPLAVVLDVDVALVIGAVISGGVFGDHCSPISDTTIISSMAAKCDHIEHVKTQLPYALTAGTIALVLFIVVGMAGAS